MKGNLNNINIASTDNTVEAISDNNVSPISAVINDGVAYVDPTSIDLPSPSNGSDAIDIMSRIITSQSESLSKVETVSDDISAGNVTEGYRQPDIPAESYFKSLYEDISKFNEFTTYEDTKNMIGGHVSPYINYDYDNIRAHGQTGGELAYKASMQFLGQAASDIVGTIGVITSIPELAYGAVKSAFTDHTLADTMEDIMNEGITSVLFDASSTMNDYIQNEFEILQTNEAKSGFALSDATWWAANSPSLASVAVSMVTSLGITAGVTKGANALMRLGAKGLKSSNNIAKGLGGASKTIGKGISSAKGQKLIYAANSVNQDIFTEIAYGYNDKIEEFKRLGMTQEDAESATANWAADAYTWGVTVGAGFEIMSANLILGKGKRFGRLDSALDVNLSKAMKNRSMGIAVPTELDLTSITEKTGRKTASRITKGLYGAGLEGFEEMRVDFILDNAMGAAYDSEDIEHSGYGASVFARMGDFLSTPSSYTSFFFGALGGGITTIATADYTLSEKKNALLKERLTSAMDAFTNIESAMAQYLTMSKEGNTSYFSKEDEGVVRLDTSVVTDENGNPQVHAPIMDVMMSVYNLSQMGVSEAHISTFINALKAYSDAELATYFNVESDQLGAIKHLIQTLDTESKYLKSAIKSSKYDNRYISAKNELKPIVLNNLIATTYQLDYINRQYAKLYNNTALVNENNPAYKESAKRKDALNARDAAQVDAMVKKERYELLINAMTELANSQLESITSVKDISSRVESITSQLNSDKESLFAAIQNDNKEDIALYQSKVNDGISQLQTLSIYKEVYSSIRHMAESTNAIATDSISAIVDTARKELSKLEGEIAAYNEEHSENPNNDVYEIANRMSSISRRAIDSNIGLYSNLMYQSEILKQQMSMIGSAKYNETFTDMLKDRKSMVENINTIRSFRRLLNTIDSSASLSNLESRLKEGDWYKSAKSKTKAKLDSMIDIKRKEFNTVESQVSEQSTPTTVSKIVEEVKNSTPIETTNEESVQDTTVEETSSVEVTQDADGNPAQPSNSEDVSTAVDVEEIVDLELEAELRQLKLISKLINDSKGAVGIVNLQDLFRSIVSYIKVNHKEIDINSNIAVDMVVAIMNNIKYIQKGFSDIKDGLIAKSKELNDTYTNEINEVMSSLQSVLRLTIPSSLDVPQYYYGSILGINRYTGIRSSLDILSDMSSIVDDDGVIIPSSTINVKVRGVKNPIALTGEDAYNMYNDLQNPDVELYVELTKSKNGYRVFYKMKPSNLDKEVYVEVSNTETTIPVGNDPSKSLLVESIESVYFKNAMDAIKQNAFKGSDVITIFENDYKTYAASESNDIIEDLIFAFVSSKVKESLAASSDTDSIDSKSLHTKTREVAFNRAKEAWNLLTRTNSTISKVWMESLKSSSQFKQDDIESLDRSIQVLISNYKNQYKSAMSLISDLKQMTTSTVKLIPINANATSRGTLNFKGSAKSISGLTNGKTSNMPFIYIANGKITSKGAPQSAIDRVQRVVNNGSNDTLFTVVSNPDGTYSPIPVYRSTLGSTIYNEAKETLAYIFTRFATTAYSITPADKIAYGHTNADTGQNQSIDISDIISGLSTMMNISNKDVKITRTSKTIDGETIDVVTKVEFTIKGESNIKGVKKSTQSVITIDVSEGRNAMLSITSNGTTKQLETPITSMSSKNQVIAFLEPVLKSAHRGFPVGDSGVVMAKSINAIPYVDIKSIKSTVPIYEIHNNRRDLSKIKTYETPMQYYVDTGALISNLQPIRDSSGRIISYYSPNPSYVPSMSLEFIKKKEFTLSNVNEIFANYKSLSSVITNIIQSKGGFENLRYVLSSDAILFEKALASFAKSGILNTIAFKAKVLPSEVLFQYEPIDNVIYYNTAYGNKGYNVDTVVRNLTHEVVHYVLEQGMSDITPAFKQRLKDIINVIIERGNTSESSSEQRFIKDILNVINYTDSVDLVVDSNKWQELFTYVFTNKGVAENFKNITIDGVPVNLKLVELFGDILSTSTDIEADVIDRREAIPYTDGTTDVSPTPSTVSISKVDIVDAMTSIVNVYGVNRASSQPLPSPLVANDSEVNANETDVDETVTQESPQEDVVSPTTNSDEGTGSELTQPTTQIPTKKDVPSERRAGLKGRGRGINPKAPTNVNPNNKPDPDSKQSAVVKNTAESIEPIDKC